MIHLPIAPRRVAPYVISGATGVHVFLRMRHLSRQPATDAPLYFFLLKNTDVLLALGGASVVLWQLAKAKPRQGTTGSPSARLPNSSAVIKPNKSLVIRVAHELRQVFTSLLLGLDLIDRKVETGDMQAISRLVQRLKSVVRRSIAAIEMLESAGAANGHEREYGA